MDSIRIKFLVQRGEAVEKGVREKAPGKTGLGV